MAKLLSKYRTDGFNETGSCLSAVVVTVPVRKKDEILHFRGFFFSGLPGTLLFYARELISRTDRA